MAWYLDPNTNELAEQEENQGVDLSGSGSAGGSTSPGAAPMTPAPTSSGNFTNINRYIENNQDQSQALGNKVASGIETKTQGATTALNGAEQEFNTQLSGANPLMGENDISGLASDPRKLADYVKDQSNVDKFKSTAAGGYGGPNSFSDIGNYADLIKNVSGAAQAPEKLKTSGGRQDVIKDAYNDPSRAKAGMLGLDDALLKQTPGAMAPVQEKADAAGNLNTRLADIQNNANTAIASTKQNVNDRSKQIQDSFLGQEGVYNKFKSGIDGRVGDISTRATGGMNSARNYLDQGWLKQNGIIEDFRRPTPSNFNKDYVMPMEQRINREKAGAIPPEVLRQLGIDRNQYEGMLQKWANPATRQTPVTDGWKNKSFGDFASYGDPTSINRGNVASADEYAELGALSQLFGDKVDANFLATPDQAGKYNDDLVDFKYQDLINFLDNPKYRDAVVSNGG